MPTAAQQHSRQPRHSKENALTLRENTHAELVLHCGGPNRLRQRCHIHVGWRDTSNRDRTCVSRDSAGNRYESLKLHQRRARAECHRAHAAGAQHHWRDLPCARHLHPYEQRTRQHRPFHSRLRLPAGVGPVRPSSPFGDLLLAKAACEITLQLRETSVVAAIHSMRRSPPLSAVRRLRRAPTHALPRGMMPTRLPAAGTHFAPAAPHSPLLLTVHIAWTGHGVMVTLKHM